jgi:hypothetical protein
MCRRLSLGRRLVLLAGLVVLSSTLAGAPVARASDPSINAVPATVTLPAGQTFGPVTITWTTGDKGNGWQAWRVSPAPSSDPTTCPTKASSTEAEIGSMGFPTLNTTNTNKTNAYAGDNVFLLCDQKGNVLTSTHVTGQQAPAAGAAATSASIAADPNPATVPAGELTAQVTLSWDPAGTTSWYVSGPDSYGRPTTIQKCGFLSTCTPPFSQSVAVVPGDNPFTLVNSDTSKPLGSVTEHAAYPGGSVQLPSIKADPASVPITSGQQAGQASLTCYAGGGSSAGQIWYSRPGGAGQPPNTGQVMTSGGTKSTCADTTKVDIFLGDNAFTLWDASMQQQLATVHVQGQAAQCASPCVLKPTRVVADTTWQGDGDSACGTKPAAPSPSAGPLSDPVDQAGGDVGAAGYKVGQTGFVCWSYQNSGYTIGVGFDMSAIAQFVAAHGLKSGTLRYGTQGDSCFTSDSIVVSNESTTWNTFPSTYGILEVLPPGSSATTASQLPAVGAGTTATGPHGEHLLGGDPTASPSQVGVGYWLNNPIGDAEHFVLTGSSGPTDSNGAWSCDETVAAFSLLLIGDH